MWQWPLQRSALSFELSKEQGRKKKIQHTTSSVTASENPWIRNFFFQSCFAVDKFSPRDQSAFKLFCVWFLGCVTIASKTCEQEDGEISGSPSPSIKMAECLVMLTLPWVTRTECRSRFVERCASILTAHQRLWNKSCCRNSKTQPMPLLPPSSALHGSLPAQGRAGPKAKPSFPMTSAHWALTGASLRLLPDLKPPSSGRCSQVKKCEIQSRACK